MDPSFPETPLLINLSRFGRYPLFIKGLITSKVAESIPITNTFDFNFSRVSYYCLMSLHSAGIWPFP